MAENVVSRHVRVGDISIGNDLPLVRIAGPCQSESLDHALMMADRIATACLKIAAKRKARVVERDVAARIARDDGPEPAD